MNKENQDISILSKAKKIVETEFTDEANGLLSIGFQLISVCPRKEFENSFLYSLMWNGNLNDVDPSEFRRVNQSWPFLSDNELFSLLGNDGL